MTYRKNRLCHKLGCSGKLRTRDQGYDSCVMPSGPNPDITIREVCFHELLSQNKRERERERKKKGKKERESERERQTERKKKQIKKESDLLRCLFIDRSIYIYICMSIETGYIYILYVFGTCLE